VVLSLGVFETHGSLMLAIILGLVIGKPVGIVLAAWLAVRFGIAVKPAAYSWRQLCGAGVLAGIGFTMSLFIAGEAFPDPADYAAAKIAIFLASFIAGVVGAVMLWPRNTEDRRLRSLRGLHFPASATTSKVDCIRTSGLQPALRSWSPHAHGSPAQRDHAREPSRHDPDRRADALWARYVSLPDL
jgi:hypothetical protein